MGFKDFMNKMAEKQAEANKKAISKIEKGKRRIEELNEEAKEKIDMNNERYEQKRVQREASYLNEQTETKKRLEALNTEMNKIKVNESIKISNKQKEKKYQKERVDELKREHIPFCPKCKSTSITYVSKRKKLSLGRAVVGGAIGTLAGPLGTAAGATMGGLSSNKMKKGTIKCLNCGHTWKL